MIVFSVETSCDETSVCIINNKKEMLSHIIYSQEDHKKFGGVIPELASRAHLQIIQKISKKAVKEAKINIKEIDIFTATCGPGLIGALLVGSIFTKALAVSTKKPFVPINHLEGHLLSPTYNNNVNYPYITFLLTGGHTQIYLINAVNNYELLGETMDDAVGEAFDKVSKLLGMPYPGGPEIEKKAIYGNENKFLLPHPLKKDKNLNFSFSGIKTATSLIIQKQKKFDEFFISNIAASFQKTVADILKTKLDITYKYLKSKKINISQIALVGGVAANKYIYNKIKICAKMNNCEVILPIDNMLSDNAAMIGWACIQKTYLKDFSNIHFNADPRLKTFDL